VLKISKRLKQLFQIIYSSVILLVLSFSLHAQPVTYIFGVVPQFEPIKLRHIWQPIINQLEKQTGYYFKIKGSPTIPDFENEFMQGKFDFVYMNPFHLVMANQQQNYKPIVRDVSRVLQGILVTKKNSGISDLKQLQNKVIAFPAPNALGASLQMRQELHDGFGLNFYPRYVNTHDSVYLNVLLGEAAAGGGVKTTLKRQPEAYQNNLKIIYKTKPVSPHPIAVHPRVPEKVVKAVTQAFLHMGQTEEGKRLLRKIPIKRLGKASLDDYEPIKKMGLMRFFVK